MVFCYTAVVFQVVWFLIEYVRVVIPLKDQIKDGDLLAPPKWTTLEYHIWFGYIMLILALATLWAMNQDRPLNPVSIALIPGVIRMFFVLRKFRLSYTVRLKAWKESGLHSAP